MHICFSWAMVGPGHCPGGLERGFTSHLSSLGSTSSAPVACAGAPGPSVQQRASTDLRGRLPVCNPIWVCHLRTGTASLHHSDTVNPATTYSSEDAFVKHHMTLWAAAMTTADVWDLFDSRFKTKTSHGEAFFFFYHKPWKKIHMCT